MLKNIDPLLGPELLSILRAMGHGDEIVIADGNFPSASTARRLVRLDGVSASRALRAIISVLPLDSFVPHAAFRMAVVGNEAEVPGIVGEFVALLKDAGYSGGIEAIERFAFYERAAKAYAVIATGEPRHYGNLILKKGTIPPDSRWASE